MLLVFQVQPPVPVTRWRGLQPEVSGRQLELVNFTDKVEVGQPCYS